MTDIERRCGTCRHFTRLVDGTYCGFVVPSHLPYWAISALDFEAGDVDEGDGKDCNTWEYLGRLAEGA
jgi:hypothetical protein